MNLGFKDRFEPMVLDGTKRHTIRAGNRWKAGMRADLYVRPRQRDMRLLFRAIVLRVEDIQIRSVLPNGIGGVGDLTLEVRIGGLVLDPGETEAFFFRDGFREQRIGSLTPATREAYRFWNLGRKTFVGQLIHWDYEKRFMDISETCYRISEWKARLAA